MEIEDWDEIVPPKDPARKPEPKIPTSKLEVFKCEAFNCKMAAYHCPQRQIVGMKVAGFRKVNHYLCQSGKCGQGRKIMRQQWAKDYVTELRTAATLAEKEEI